LDGVYTASEKTNPMPVAVVIDNQEEAWPNFGLSQASLVYEVETEAKITRYLALFVDLENLSQVGPVRSARPYLVSLAEENGAVFAHCGGSQAALDLIKKNKVKDLNEYCNAPYFWRDSSLAGPHNVFSSGSKLQDYLNNKEYRTGSFFGWNFKDELPPEQRPVESRLIEIGFRAPYNVDWQYDTASNSYVRFLNDSVHLDNEQEIRARNILIQRVAQTVLDKDLRLKVDLEGKGEAIICLDGTCRTGFWQKNNSAKTRYYYDDNSEVSFIDGPTWVELVGESVLVSY
jgi:hypothetical protein